MPGTVWLSTNMHAPRLLPYTSLYTYAAFLSPRHLVSLQRPQQAIVASVKLLQKSGCTDCSHRQSHIHTAPVPVPASTSASLTLLDVLHEVPRLPELLTADTQKALSAVSQSFRERRTAPAQVVTVTCEQDLRLINKWSSKGRSGWPLLSMIILPTYTYRNALPILHPRLEAHIYISSEKNNSHAAISLLRPLHTPVWNMTWVSTAAQQMQNQMAAKWPELSSFGMGCVRLDALGTTIIAQLAKGEWPSLRYLSLSECRLGAQAVLSLSEGKWPGLQILDLSCNCLDAEGMALLAKGNWPLLKEIQLNETPP